MTLPSEFLHTYHSSSHLILSSVGENPSLSTLTIKPSSRVSYMIRNCVWNQVRWDPCHHGMAHPQVADGGQSSRYGG